jgi:Mg2+/Co2+ transporter CorC
VSEQFIKRVARVAERNKSRLIKEINEREDVLNLLRKARSNELTLDEKERMRLELIHMMKTLPTFVIIALPQKFLTLPILLKILPRNLFAEGVN